MFDTNRIDVFNGCSFFFFHVTQQNCNHNTEYTFFDNVKCCCELCWTVWIKKKVQSLIQMDYFIEMSSYWRSLYLLIHSSMSYHQSQVIQVYEIYTVRLCMNDTYTTQSDIGREKLLGSTCNWISIQTKYRFSSIIEDWMTNQNPEIRCWIEEVI